MHRDASTRVLATAAAAALVGGGLLSVQSRLNGELSVRFRAPMDAALWSFGSGWVLLTLVLVAVPGVRRALIGLPDALRGNRIRWWECLGGVAGGAFVAVQTYAVPLAGVAVFTIAVVGGQTGNALVVDRLGLGPGGKVPVTRGRVLAALVAVAGVGVAVSGRGGGGASGIVVPALLALGVGAVTTVQQATNGRLNMVSGTMVTTWLNFSTGTCFLLALLVGRLVTGTISSPTSLEAPWWAWWGGLCGIGFVAMAAVVVRYLGILVFTLAALTGQLAAAVALDLLSAHTRAQIGGQVVLGVLVTFVAALTAGYLANRGRVGTSAA